MSIEAIVEKIIEDARKSAEKIRAETQEEIKEIEKTGRANIEDVCSHILQDAEDEAIQKKERLRIAANMESRKGELEEKHSMISMAFERALKEINNLGKAKYQELIEPELLRSEGVEEVITPPDEKRVDEEFLNGVNRLLVKNGKKGNLKLSKEKRQIPGGGFILKKGNIESNNAFGILLESVRNQIELKISKILFEK